MMALLLPRCGEWDSEYFSLPIGNRDKVQCQSAETNKGTSTRFTNHAKALGVPEHLASSNKENNQLLIKAIVHGQI
jgi:hypothetical protein